MEQTVMTLGGMTADAKPKRRYGKPKGAADHLTYEELKKIVSLPDRRTKEGIRDYALLLVLSETPMRRGEICNLKTSDLVNEGEKKFLTYAGLKKRKARPYYLKIDISDNTYEAIKRYLALDATRKADSPMFFTLGSRGPYGALPITPFAVHLLVKKYGRLAGINKRISPHSFRATFVTLRSDQHDPFTLQQTGGWSSINSIMPYARRVKERVREAALAFPVGG